VEEEKQESAGVGLHVHRGLGPAWATRLGARVSLLLQGLRGAASGLIAAASLEPCSASYAAYGCEWW
jgi:hypothetical protein